MADRQIRYSVFTKPWRTLVVPELAALVRQLGFDGVELPVRPGYQVTPERVGEGLPAAALQFAAEGVAIYSIAGPADEMTVAACAEAGVSTIRVMAQVREGERYLQAETRLQREFDALMPLLERYGVALGVQNHCDRFVANALGLMRLIGRYDPSHVYAVWDAAHEALNGGLPEYALDVVWSHLGMVNLKNAFWQRTNGPEAECAQWRHYWTNGRHGLASWPKVIAELRRRSYEGVVCLTAEYSDESLVESLISQDIAYARALFAQPV
jgi:sugar phosphate isomerase/epimerase